MTPWSSQELSPCQKGALGREARLDIQFTLPSRSGRLGLAQPRALLSKPLVLCAVWFLAGLFKNVVPGWSLAKLLGGVVEGNIEEFSVLVGMLMHPLVQAPVFWSSLLSGRCCLPHHHF